MFSGDSNMIRKKIQITITLDKVVVDKVKRYIKSKGISFDDYVNRVIENRMKFIVTQRNNALKTYAEKRKR